MASISMKAKKQAAKSTSSGSSPSEWPSAGVGLFLNPLGGKFPPKNGDHGASGNLPLKHGPARVIGSAAASASASSRVVLTRAAPNACPLSRIGSHVDAHNSFELVRADKSRKDARVSDPCADVRVDAYTARDVEQCGGNSEPARGQSFVAHELLCGFDRTPRSHWRASCGFFCCPCLGRKGCWASVYCVDQWSN